MSDYWDLDDILSECEPVRCELIQPARGLQTLTLEQSNNPVSQSSSASTSTNTKKRALSRHERTQSSPSHSLLPAKAVLTLPLWLATPLLTRDFVRISPPNSMNSKSIERMRADATNLDLRAQCEHFYRIGIKIAQLSGPGSELHGTLKLMLHSRYQELIYKTSSLSVAVTHQHFLTQQASLASNSFLSTPSLLFSKKLDAMELKMLVQRLKGLMGLARFNRRDHCKIQKLTHNTVQFTALNGGNGGQLKRQSSLSEDVENEYGPNQTVKRPRR